MLNLHPKLVIIGKPGSGKSAFVNFLAMCLAGEQVGDKICNLKLLTQGIPDNRGIPQVTPQTWMQGKLIPIRIILRDFVSSKEFRQPQEEANQIHLLNFIKAHLQKIGNSDYFEILQQRLHEGRVLLMFDGLDEVPQAGDHREKMKECIEEFHKTYNQNRLLVTVRPYAYEKDKWKIAGCLETHLANFNQGQINALINYWYQKKNCPELDEETIQERKENLKIGLHQKTVYELAERPLLLSLIAFLHQKRNTLPDRRAALYEELLKLLLEQWEKVRFKGTKVIEPGLADYLQVGYDEIRKVLERLAFMAHSLQGTNSTETADIAQKDLVNELWNIAKKHTINPNALEAFLCNRIGILHQRGGENEQDTVYTFPHRSFQEYLAASYFKRAENKMFEQHKLSDNKKWSTWKKLAAYLGVHNPDQWREVVVLAGAIQASNAEDMAGLLSELIGDADLNKPLTDTQCWGLRLAIEITAENIENTTENYSVIDVKEEIKKLGQYLITRTDFNVRERVTAGRYLGIIGDPRPEVLYVDQMQFCLVASGEFCLDKDDNDKQNLSYCYAIARYPVTVAQYQEYLVSSEGNNLIDYAGLANEPVVGVTWTQAKAFCTWLTQRWKTQNKLPPNYEVILPTKKEWVKAARGGLQIPISPIKFNIEQFNQLVGQASSIQLQNNNLNTRLYPWGNDLDINYLNYGDSQIDKVSAVGCYPNGASPYGCEEMAGNVWEWTRTSDTPNLHGWYVIQGGSFSSIKNRVGCIACDRSANGNPNKNLGFRVVVSKA